MRKPQGKAPSLLAALFFCLISVCLVLPAPFVLSGCSAKGAEHEITVAGSTTVLPIAEVTAEKIKEEQGINALVSGLGSSAGIEAVMNGTADIATSSRDLTAAEAETGELQKTVIAHDGIAIIVNPQNPLQNISLENLRAVYAGKITNWKELGGPDETILVVNRDEASGTREAFKTIVMQGTPFDKTSAVLPGTGQVRDVVSRTKNAIGYISLGFVNSNFTRENVKALSVGGVAPTEQNIQNQTYPISRDLYFFTKGPLSKDVAAFINLVLSDQMDETIREAGYIPLFPFEKTAEQTAALQGQTLSGANSSEAPGEGAPSEGGPSASAHSSLGEVSP